MATFAIGDIHGNFAALDDLLGQVRHVASEHDVVVFLGDYIDRGPGTKDCIDAVLGFQRATPAEVVCLCGNHEDWLLQTLRDPYCHSWLVGMAAFPTIRSYSVDAERALGDAIAAAGAEVIIGRCRLPYEVFFDCVPAEHIRFFESLRPYYEGTDAVYAHGGLDPRVRSLGEQTRDAFIWGPNGFPRAYEGLETVVYGHWNNAVLDADGWPTPAIFGRTIGIDTISHGVLTAIRMPDRQIFQSDRHEKRRDRE
jgi:serine/threonine protein phosphatase 1